jgi:type VI secretion system protein ImpA
MATPPLLDFEALIAPIPGENPAGDPVPFELRQQLDEARRETNPEDVQPDEMKRADWPDIIRTTQAILQQTSKDLLTAARLTEALTKEYGFAGVRDGLHLLTLLLDQCWERLNPPIEDGDLEPRVTPFTWLDDPGRGARFPSTLRTVPIIMDKGNSLEFGWQEWRKTQDGKGAVSVEDLEKAIQATNAEFSHQLVEDITESAQEAFQLTQKLNERLMGDAPSLAGIREALDNSLTLAKEISQRKGGGAAAQPTEAGGQQTADGADGVARAGKVAATRDEAYRQLAQLAALLKQLEPHSPIPYFLERAVAMGALPFPLMIKELVRVPEVLTELNRELGIKEASS